MAAIDTIMLILAIVSLIISIWALILVFVKSPSSGAQGPEGTQGVMGPTGSIIGNTGPIGPVGASGGQGNIGPTGPIGPDGMVGFPGPTGPIGSTGTNLPSLYFISNGQYNTQPTIPVGSIVDLNQVTSIVYQNGTGISLNSSQSIINIIPGIYRVSWYICCQDTSSNPDKEPGQISVVLSSTNTVVGLSQSRGYTNVQSDGVSMQMYGTAIFSCNSNDSIYFRNDGSGRIQLRTLGATNFPFSTTVSIIKIF